MSKKKEKKDKTKINKVQKKKDKKLKKSIKSHSLIKDNVKSTKTAILKAKKNQLRCHYCKLLMLRSNYARHLKSQHSNKFKKDNLN